MLQAIQKERMLEFPGEMLRKQDLIRWNLLGKNVKETVTNMKALRDRTGDYADVPTDVYTRTKMENWKFMAWIGVSLTNLQERGGRNWIMISLRQS